MANTIKTGDPWTLCDSCGFQIRRSQTRKMWDGKVVCLETCWDEKFPKTGVKIPSMIRPNIGVRPQRSAEAGTTTLGADVSGLVIDLANASTVTAGTDIGIVLDDGTVHWTIVTTVYDDTTVVIETEVPGSASAGNTVYIGGDNNEAGSAKITGYDVDTGQATSNSAATTAGFSSAESADDGYSITRS